MANNLDHFIFNSDYPIDQIVFYKAIDSAVTADSTWSTSIKHGLPFKPLIVGVWSTTSDFSVTIPIDETGFSMKSKSYSDRIELSLDVDTSITSGHIWIRVYGLEPANGTGGAAKTNVSSNNFLLDTDKDYSQLLFNGAFTSDISSEGIEKVYYTYKKYDSVVDTASNVVVYHNLGFLPQVIMWAEDLTASEPYIYRSWSANFDYSSGIVVYEYPTAQIFNDRIIFNFGNYPSYINPPLKFYVRAYADGQSQ